MQYLPIINKNKDYRDTMKGGKLWLLKAFAQLLNRKHSQ